LTASSYAEGAEIGEMKHPLGWQIRNPLTLQMSWRDWLFWYCFVVFMGSVIPLFFWVAEPSLLGRNDWRVWADSPVFLWIAGVDTDPGLLLAEHSDELDRPPSELDWTHMVTFSSNSLGPVLIGFLAGTNFRIMLVNFALFFLSLYYLFKLTDIRKKLLTLLIVLNPFTIISIWTVNKEIIALLSVALLACYLESRRWFLLPAVVVVSFFARWEQAAFVILFLLTLSRFNPLRRHRLASLTVVLLALSVIYPLMNSMTAAWDVSSRSSHAMMALNSLQDKYLYFLVFVPKIAANFVPLPLLTFRNMDWHDVANGIGMLGHQALMVGVAVALIVQRKFRLKSDAFFCAVLLVAISCLSPIIQPRYLYPAYILACIEVATRRKREVYQIEAPLRAYVDSLRTPQTVMSRA
jgi:hypothetical protein